MAQSVIQASFGSGELSKNLYARVDLDRYRTGAALLRNFFIDYRGGASTRMGFEFKAQTKSTGTPRIIGFSFSTTQTYLLEFGNLYLRIFSGGAPLAGATGAITGISQANPGVVTSTAHGRANGDTVILAGIVGMTELNGRTFIVADVTANTFTLKRILDSSVVSTTAYTAYTSGGTWTVPYELTTPYAEADLPLLKFAQSADTMTLTHPSYPIQLLKRTGASTFTLSAMVIAPTMDSPTGLTLTFDNAGAKQYGYVVTAVSADGREEGLPSKPSYVTADLIGDSLASGIRLKWNPVAQQTSQYKIYKYGPIQQNASGRHMMCSTFGFVGYALAPQWSDYGSVPDFSKQPPLFVDPFSPGQIQGPITITAVGSYTDLAPPTVTTSGGTGSGASFHAVLNDAGGVSYVSIDKPGSWTVQPTLSFTGTATGTIPSLSPLTGTYPSCVSYFQQRQAFAASNNDPEDIWTSQTGNVFNFDAASIPLPADGISVTLASRQVNQIKSMVSVPSGLILLTSGGSWLLSGGGAKLAVTPIEVVAQPQASTGANDVPPININNDILYIQARGNTVRDLVFSFDVESFFGTDRSALANHLFFGYQILEWSYAEEPFRTIWAVRNDGQLLCLTYVPEQEVFAWSHSDTQGQFISIASIVEGQEDAVYVVVKRFVAGLWVNFIERLHSRNFYENVEFAFCADSALSLPQSSPNADLTLSAATGTATITASASVFTSADTGKVLRGLRGGKGTITYISGTSCSIIIVPDGRGINSFPVIPNDPTKTPMRIQSGQWNLAAPVTTLRGLDNLVGKTVTGLADGRVISGLTVSSDGAITLTTPASYVVIGLGFQAQLQTLYLDVGDPTIQGKRKLIPQCTIMVDDSLGVKVGTVFDQLVEYLNPAMAGVITSPPPLVSSDDLVGNIPWDWTVKGQVCIQQDYPLPATILGIIPQVVVGDTGR